VSVDIARLHVDWTLDAQPGAEPQRRLDTLVTDLREQALEDALSSTDDGPGLTCLRAVVVPAVTVRWAAADRELVDTWAGAIGRAVAAASRSRDPETVVRYPTRAAALADVVVSLLQGDLSRSWAWDLLGVGPGARRVGRSHPRPAEAFGAASTEARLPGADATPVPGRGAAGVVAAVAALAEEAPEAVLPLVVTLARRHLLASFAGALGGPGLIALVTRAGGPAASADPPTTARGRDDMGHRTDAPAATAVLALVRMVQDRSAVLAAARASGLVTGASNQPGAPDNGRTRAAGPAQAPVTSGENVPSAPDPRTEPPGARTPPADATVAQALAAFALLEVEPAYAAQPLGRAAARMLCHGPAQPSLASGANPAAAPRRAGDREGPPAQTPTPPAQVASGAGPPAAEAEPVTPGPQTPPTPIAGGPAGSTAWGGLLFLLRLAGETGLPDRVIADPGRFGVGLRGVLHRLGAELISLAAPDVGPVNPQDPALLAFCGLATEAGPPEAAADGRVDWLDAELGRVLGLLRECLEGAPVAESSDQRLLLTVLRRRARVSVEPGWVDVELDLDEVSTAVRRAGLDLDPGHLPWLGVVVRFRYV
jgi:hypothetical protein